MPAVGCPRLERICNVADFRREARRALPKAVFDYVDGAADDETTMRANEAAFADWVFRPRMGGATAPPVIAREVLGVELRLPVLLAPCGLVRLMHPDGPAGVARAAAARGTVSVLSTVAGKSAEEVSPHAPGRLWFQLYSGGSSATADDLIAGAERLGIAVLVVTIDSAAYGNRERDVRNGVGPPLRIGPHNVLRLGWQVACRPTWVGRMAQEGRRMVKEQRASRKANLATDIMAPSPFTWQDLDWMRRRWPGRLVVKGVLTGEEARRAVDHGADGVVVSNHGGRQLDTVPATMQVLPEVAAAVAGQAAVLLDGGIRRGGDVVKALALGAQAVLVGRPYMWSLAVGGEAGVERVLELFEEEVVRTMTLLGCPSVAALGPEWLARA